MQRISLCAILGLCLMAIPAQLWADPSWCVVNHPNAVMCEDWDRHCSDPPIDPTEACGPHSGQGWDIYYGKNWVSGGSGCTGLSIEDNWFSSVPLAGRQPSSGFLGATYLSLSPFIRNKFGNQYTQMMGTDASPIVVEAVIDGAAGKLSTANIYIELTAAIKQPLTDHIESDECANCGATGNQTVFPIICRQSPTPSSSKGICPPVATAPILPSIAAGAVSYLDRDPCHCEGNDHFPQVGTLSVFDGKQWWTLNQSVVPSVFQGAGPFKLYARNLNTTGYITPGINHVRLTIKSNDILVELRKVLPNNPEAEYSWCIVPRQYKGQFSVLNFGYAEPCILKNNLWECNAVRKCVRAALGFTTSLDNVVVSGGLGYDAPGACCINRQNDNPPTITCVQANGAMDCTGTHNGTFKGPGTVCSGVACCPTFMPDHDMDLDVDLEDFGWFQTCLSAAAYAEPPTIACQCADLDGNLEVNTADFELFAACMSGPGTVADTNCLP